jgi:CcmD family protein
MPDNRAFILAAYVVTWIVILGFLLHLGRARKAATRRYENAQHDVGGKGAAGP